jgi:hypothetical protein
MVFVARLICSDPGCAEEVAGEAATLRELEVLACECGCALEVIGWPDTVRAEMTVIRLRECEAPGEAMQERQAA